MNAETLAALPSDAGLDAFAGIAQAEFDALPDGVRALTGEVEIRIAEWPEPEALRAVGVEHPQNLLGLFEGAGIGSIGGTPVTGMFPNRVWLYRQPILGFTAEGEDSLTAVIRHVLVHEIGHHFGLSDDDMYAIDDAPNDAGDGVGDEGKAEASDGGDGDAPSDKAIALGKP